MSVLKGKMLRVLSAFALTGMLAIGFLSADENDGTMVFRGKRMPVDKARRLQREDDARKVDRSAWSTAWELDTMHFYIKTDLPGREGKKIRDVVGKMLEHFYEDFKEQFKLTKGSKVYNKYRDKLDFNLDYRAVKLRDENDGELYDLKDGRYVIVCKQADKDAFTINWRAPAAILMFPDKPKNEVKFFRSGQIEGIIDGKVIKTVQPIEKKPNIYIFKNMGEYHTIGKGPISSGGYYASWKNLICVYFSGKDDESVEKFLHVLFHELTHHFVRSCIYDPPIWFNEGMADFFGASAATGKYKPGRKHPPYVEWVKKAVDKGPGYGSENFIPLRKLLNMSQAEFYGSHGWENYATGWSFLYFLAFGKKYPKRKLVEYYNKLRDGGDKFKTFEQVYGISTKKDYEIIQQHWVNYWK